MTKEHDTGRPRRPVSHYWFVAALSVAILVRLFTLWVVIQHPERAITPDSPLYLDLSRHFTQAYVNTEAEFSRASVLRTPGYPLFCYLWLHVLGDSITSILIAQNVIALACAWIAFILARRLAGHDAAKWAAVLVLVDPLALTYANLIRNEMLFTVVMTLGMLQWHQSLNRPHAASIGLTGFLFGLATLVRPVTSYLMLFILPADLWLRHRRAASVMIGAWMLVGFMAPIGGWMARNHQLSGRLTLSSIAEYNLLYYRVAGAIAEETGETRTAVASRLSSPDSSAPDRLTLEEPLPRMKTASMLRLLADHPFGAAMSTIRGMVRMLFGPGTTGLNQLFYGKSAKSGLFVGPLLAAHMLILYVAMGVGLIFLTRQRCIEPLVLVGAVVMYSLLISAGPEAYSRFRAPLIPLFAIVSGVGLTRVDGFVRSMARPAR